MWAFFGLKKDCKDDDKSVIGRLCRAVVLAGGGNTTNLFSHLKVHHMKEYASIERTRRTTNHQKAAVALALVGNR